MRFSAFCSIIGLLLSVSSLFTSGSVGQFAALSGLILCLGGIILHHLHDISNHLKNKTNDKDKSAQ